MALTDEMLVKQRHRNGGDHRIYRLPNGYGLSLVNAPILHGFAFAWEAAVLSDVKEDGSGGALAYETPLTSDVEVFDTDDEANAFIARAKEWALSGAPPAGGAL